MLVMVFQGLFYENNSLWSVCNLKMRCSMVPQVVASELCGTRRRARLENALGTLTRPSPRVISPSTLICTHSPSSQRRKLRCDQRMGLSRVEITADTHLGYTVCVCTYVYVYVCMCTLIRRSKRR